MQLIDLDDRENTTISIIFDGKKGIMSNIQAPAIDAIPTQAVKDAIAEIRKTACRRGDPSEASGLYDAIEILRKHTRVDI